MQQAIRSFVVGLVLAFSSFMAFGAFPPQGGWVASIGVYTTAPPQTTNVAVCPLLGPLASQHYGEPMTAVWDGAWGGCIPKNANGDGVGLHTPRQIPPTCPANSTLGADGMCTCNAGFDESGGMCVPPGDKICEAGGTQILNFTGGWLRTPSDGGSLTNAVGPVAIPGVAFSRACVKGCAVSIGPLTQSLMGAYISQVPSEQGLHRLSYDVVVTTVAETCAADSGDVASLAADPRTPPMPCPGYVGQVNGKTTCVGTASAPLPSPSGEGRAEAERAAINNSDHGNPTAGVRPESGVGSGSSGASRTPVEGNGSAMGGPITAAAGGKASSTGTTTSPVEGQEQQNCGAPGQPKCRIDESGTPSDFAQDKYSTLLNAPKAEADSARSTISGSGDKGMFENMRNILTSAPPIVGCSPFLLPREMGSIDPCAVVDGVRYIMGFLWAIAGLWLCFRMIKQVV